MKKTLLAIVVVISTIQATYAQSSSRNTLPQIMPKSPDVATLDKYSDIPVAECAGTASYDIPLAAINVGEFILPIKLSYYKNGLKVEEVPGSVGDGWSLQFGGIVSFQQNGVNDRKTGGLLYGGPGSSAMSHLKSYLRGQMNSFDRMTYLENIIAGSEDAEFDMYNYNFFGNSGQFFYDTLGNIQTMPKNDLKINWVGDTVVIVDNENNTYYFGGIERGQRYNTAEIDYRLSFNDITGYQLTRIVTSENRTIYFKYKSYSYAYNIDKQSISHWEAVGVPPSGCPMYGVNSFTERQEVGMLIPDSILFDNGYVKFKISTDFREDILGLAPSFNVAYIKGLTIYNSAGQKVKDYNFAQGYFGGTGTKRLKLSGVEELNGALVDRKWGFQYYNEFNSFPAFLSYSKDHWGYYNGSNNACLLPAANYTSIWLNWRNYGVSFADRNATESSITGMLKEIDYPTGGSTTIEYEPNQIKVTSYNQITNLSPYLNPPNSTSWPSVVANNTLTSNGNPVSGSFTVPGAPGSLTNVQITGFMEVDPTHFWDPLVSFTGPSPSTDLSPLYNIFIQPWTTGITGGIWTKTLEAGTYTYTLTPGRTVDGPLRYYQISNFIVQAEQLNTPQPYFLGGVRVARTIMNDSMGTPSKYRRYQYKDSITQVNFKNIPFYHSRMNNGIVSGLACFDCNSMATIQDESIVPSAGPHIEYPYVTMYDSSSAGILGKTESIYMTSVNQAGSTVNPYVRPINNSWVSGALSNQKIYKYSGGVYTLIWELQNTHQESARIGQSNGIRVNYANYCDIVNQRQYNISLSTVYTERFDLIQSKEINSLPTQQLVNQTDYTISPTNRHTLPIDQSQLDSRGGQINQKTIYSFDYDTTATSNPDVLAMRNLQRKNVLVPIETIHYKVISGTSYVIGATLTTYQQTKPVPDRIYQLRLESPILLASFVQSNTGSNFSKDSRYEVVNSFDGYDEFNQVTGFTPNSSGSLSYLYDYNKMLPVAEVQNASAAQVAYTSFEADQKGNWTYGGTPVLDSTSPTGKMSYNTTGGALSFSGLTSTKVYIVSYWLKSTTALTITGNTSGYPQKGKTTSDGWSFFTHRITGVTSVTISGGTIDEVRLYPETAMMRTYTYDPLKGVTSMCDQRNNIVYYSYDATGRLSVIRDQDRRVLKVADYQYLKPITQ